jgi:alginate O-acetyltransferase complex protein AlgI
MSIASPDFLVLALVAVLLSRASSRPGARAWVLSAASILFLASFLSEAREVLPLAAFLIVGYGSVELLRLTRSAALLGAGIALIVTAFVLLKQYGFVPAFARVPFPYLAVGLSYVLFRVLHLMIDAQQGELHSRIPGQQFFNYCLSFLTFTAGPIQSFQEFSEQRSMGPSDDPREIDAAVARVVRGFVLVCVVSAMANYVFLALSARVLEAGHRPGGIFAYAACAALYTAYLYANFAGYVHIVLGVGALMGQRLPENFAQPFAARSFLEFWSRWHITLSNWFKTYLFNPLLKRATERWPSATAAPYLGVAAFFVTFLIMGVWHGSTTVFLVYGLFLGAGASVNKLWQQWARRRWGKAAYKRACERPLLSYASRGLVFAYFAVALTCFWVNLAELRSLLGGLGFTGALAAFLALAVGGALAFLTRDALVGAAERLRVARGLVKPGWRSEFAIAGKIVMVLAVGSFFHGAPEFVYRAF